jgi:hypothetical protein
MNAVLQEQLDTYSRSVAGANSGSARTDRFADDLIDVGLRLYEAAKESVRRWHADIDRGAAPYEARDAQQFMDLYRTLDVAFDRIVPFIERAVAEGGVVEGAERFARERMYLKATLSVTPDKARRAAEQVAAGQVKPAAEVRRELLRRVQP